ncbi:hypothetical protein BHM03_00031035 [Ensete ventricosum]|nr:hypothetical protein BHM03_00031035 [Ensete ventricosum]
MTGKLYTCNAATAAVPNPRKEQRKRFLAKRRRGEGGPKIGRRGAGQRHQLVGRVHCTMRTHTQNSRLEYMFKTGSMLTKVASPWP